MNRQKDFIELISVSFDPKEYSFLKALFWQSVKSFVACRRFEKAYLKKPCDSFKYAV